MHGKQLGIFCREPVAGRVKTRLCPPLAPEQACRLYEAFLRDLFDRLGMMNKLDPTVFYAGESADGLAGMVPERFNILRQQGESLGERLRHAFTALFGAADRPSVIIGSDSPDIPLQYVKRAFIKLKHKDVVLGPSSDGGYYLVGTRSPAPGLFDGIDWGSRRVFGQTVERVLDAGLSLALLPMWYDVDTPETLNLLRDMTRALRIERGGHLAHTAAVLDELPDDRSLL